jgi:hypothetical protein
MIITVFIILITGCTLPDGLLDGLDRASLFAALAGDDSNDCQTIETACQSIHRVVSVANELPAAIINISPGTYDETDQIILNKSMTFIGESGVVINRLPGTNPDTTAHLFVTLPPSEGVVRFENLVIQGGDIGIRVGRGRLVLENVIMQNIDSNALYAGDTDLNANVSITDSQFINNGNTPINVLGENVVFSLRSTIISGNNGTAIINRGGRFDLDGVSIFDNHASGGFPSAIANSGITSTSSEGGIMNISNSSIYDNSNTEVGLETVRNVGELLSIANSTISGNDGHGIFSGRGAETILTHVTIANHEGAGVIAPDVPDVRVSITNSLIVYNGRDCELFTSYSGVSPIRAVSNNNIDSDNTCRETQSTDRAAWDFYPGVDSNLQVNGVGTPTHALLADSPVIDSVACLVGVPSDQRGISRPQGVRCDAGAFELEPVLGAPPLAPSGTPLAVVQETTPESTLVALPTLIIESPTPAPPPYVRFTSNAYCRSGPGTVYAIISSFLQGQEAPILGRNADGTWLWISGGGNIRCFVSTITVDQFGTLSDLEVIPAPPTPTFLPSSTPTTAVQVPSAPQQLYIDNKVCNGQTYSVPFKWTDTSNNEQGFRVFRDGVLLTTLGANSTSFTDNPSYGGPYTYGVEAYNSAGASSRPTIVEAGCIP